MNELADRIVALGVGRKESKSHKFPYTLDGMTYQKPERFVRDGRVVLAMMEKLIKEGTDDDWLNFCECELAYIDPAFIEIGPAILTACCDALEGT